MHNLLNIVCDIYRSGWVHKRGRKWLLFAAVNELESLQSNNDDSDDNEQDFHMPHDTEGVCGRLENGLWSGLRDQMFGQKNPVMVTPVQAITTYVLTSAPSLDSMSQVPETLPAANDPCWCGSGRKYKRCHKGTEGRIQPGIISPMRTVPDNIGKPPYALTGVPPRNDESRVKTPEVIERMRVAGAAAAEILRRAGEMVRPGITTDEIDIFVHNLTIEMGGYPSPLNYHNYPKSVCTSVNEVICHGIPDSRVLEDGDIIDIDVTIYLNGVHGDTNASFAVGTISDEDKKLIKVTEECMWLGIEAVRPGVALNEIGRAIETHAKKHKFGVVRAFIGHGIGENFHTDIQVLHYFDPRNTMILREGMTFTIEPMITASGETRHKMWDDDWTAVTSDGSRTAQFEHTMVVTADGVDVLTAGAGAVSPSAPWNR